MLFQVSWRWTRGSGSSMMLMVAAGRSLLAETLQWRVMLSPHCNMGYLSVPSAESILAILDALGCGGIILDAKGRVLQTNDKAQRYLGSQFDIRQRGGFPKAREKNEAVQLALREALKSSTQVFPHLGSYIIVPRELSRPLLLRSIIIPDESQLKEGATAALIVLDMDDCPQPGEEILRDIFLLTPAEARLAQRLSCGESLEEISESLRIKIATARVQLRALFLKTGTRRQGELISLLAHLTRINSA